MTRSASHEAVRVLVGLAGLTLLTALCFWLDFRVISTAFAYLILIVLAVPFGRLRLPDRIVLRRGWLPEFLFCAAYF